MSGFAAGSLPYSDVFSLQILQKLSSVPAIGQNTKGPFWIVLCERMFHWSVFVHNFSLNI